MGRNLGCPEATPRHLDFRHVADEDNDVVPRLPTLGNPSGFDRRVAARPPRLRLCSIFLLEEPAMTRRLAALLLSTFALLAVVRTLPASADEPKKPTSVLDFKVQDINDKPIELSKFKGDVLLIVNTASYCGLTPQYEALEAAYEKYKDKGFAVLAFPANEFGNQEPKSDSEIKQFCTTKYNVTFPLFSKIVVKGQGIHPLYQFLTSKETDPKFAGEIKWNFNKFLVNRKGEVIARFEPAVKPDSPKVVKAIEDALAEPK
jgi:glutathione peroxidase